MDGTGIGIDGIFDQLLDDRSRALYHLTSGYLVGNAIGQKTDQVAPVKDIVSIEGTDIVVPHITRQSLALIGYLVQRVHRPGGLGGPDALELAVLHEHTELGGLLIVIYNRYAIAFLKEIANQHIVLGTGFTDIAIHEKGKHLLGGQLVVTGGVAPKLLDGHAIADDMGMVDHGVFHIHVDTVAKQLLGIVPDDGVMIHRHTGVE